MSVQMTPIQAQIPISLQTQRVRSFAMSLEQCQVDMMPYLQQTQPMLTLLRCAQKQWRVKASHSKVKKPSQLRQ
eukprot:SAG31_NODE_480_length_15108_cov_56.073423_12_plen_74_part_00